MNPTGAMTLPPGPEIEVRFEADGPGQPARIKDAMREAVGLK